jgi:hemerythrin
MSVSRDRRGMEVVKICPAAFLLRIPDEDISWLFNPWPDIAKFLIQQGLGINGVVYPDLRMQTVRGVSCNLIEFPLLHALFNQGMLFRGEKPCLVGTRAQLQLASASFKRGLYGFFDVSEMEGCDLSDAECHSLMREIAGLSHRGIQEVDELLEMIVLAPLEERPSPATATRHRGIRIWKESFNVFGVEYRNQRVSIDCTLQAGEDYVPPLKIDVKDVPFKMFQIIDTGEEDGFSPKSCMHTLIQWRSKIICIDLPMNVSYLLEKVSTSKTEIDAVIFTHNHDDHIGELSMLLHLDKKITVLCPRIVWKSILLKASAMFAMEIDELAGYFDYIPLRYGQEYDYMGLRILAHPSIHSVPCAIYRIRGIVDQGWKSYGHMSDILNFKRCQKLIREGHITPERFEAYRRFLLEPMTVKKIDVATRGGNEETSVHGSWKDFQDDASEHLILGHIRAEYLDPPATVTVGQVAVAGSARDMGAQVGHSYQDKYRERALKLMADHLFELVEDRIERGLVQRQQVLAYLRLLGDCEVRLIQPNTPFLKMGGKSTFVDMVISGRGSVWTQRAGDWVQIASVNAGDLIGDMGVLMQIPRTASIRSETYLYVLRIPGFLFREIAISLGLFSADSGEGNGESVLEKIWRHREIVQASQLFGPEVPVFLQNRIAQRAVELQLEGGALVYPQAAAERSLVLGADPQALAVEWEGRDLPPDTSTPPVFGEHSFLSGEPERYRVVARRQTIALYLDRGVYGWIGEVPIFRLRLKQLAEQRSHAARQDGPG